MKLFLVFHFPTDAAPQFLWKVNFDSVKKSEEMKTIKSAMSFLLLAGYTDVILKVKLALFVQV